MPKKEHYCDDCDATFSVSHQKGFEINYCPQCGALLDQEESNIFDDED